MARSSGTTISVKIPINWDVMTSRKKQKLRQIVGRDTRVICAYLGVIEQHENELLVGRNKDRIDESKLDRLTLTAHQVNKGKNPRTSVPHDFKERFQRISRTEFAECRQTATASYEGYLAYRRRGRKISRPNRSLAGRRIPRWIFIPYRAMLVEHKTNLARWWLDVRNSLDSVKQGKRQHDRLLVPLKVSPFHLNQLGRGDTKALQIFVDSSGKWWVTIALRLEQPTVDRSDSLPLAVLGIDLGIKKSACSTLITEKRVSETRYFSQKDKIKRLEKLDTLVSDLQREIAIQRSNGKEPLGQLEKLKSLRGKRRRVAREYDRVLVKELLSYITSLSEKYRLYVALGKVSGIRNIARKGNGLGNSMRGMIHRWAFARISDQLEHGLEQLGWKTKGKHGFFRRVPEAWTSIVCWKCGRKGSRPKQSLFVCRCGFRTNADRNGSLNIAHRLIKLIPSSMNENGLGRWARPERAPAPKAGRKISFKQKSSLPSKDGTSHLGESAAVHSVQMDLLSFGDKTGLCDDDHAVASTVENLSGTIKDANGTYQEKEVRSDGGIVSQ
jgi:transposase